MDASSIPQTGLARFLGDVTLLDMTNVLSGPFAGYLLTLLGARTIKIENPKSGDLSRSLGPSSQRIDEKMGIPFLAQNAGKKSLAVDLKTPEGLEIFLRLVAKSDVVLENFRPGVMTRLGLGYDTLVAHRPDLIYCAISGYGQDGPDAAKPAYDQIIQGKSGLMDVTGSATSGPLRCGAPIADTVGGLQAAMAIVAALYHRKTTGQGHFIDISLLEAMMPMMGWVASNYCLAGIVPERMGNENATAAPSGLFKTRSGFLNLAANNEAQWRKLCRVLNMPELLEDARFSPRKTRIENRAALSAILQERLMTKSAAQWEELLASEGIPCGELLTFEQALNQPQIKARNPFTNVDSQALGILNLFGLSAKFDRCSQRAPEAMPPPPRLGEHTRAILTAMNYSPERIDALTKRGIISCGP